MTDKFLPIETVIDNIEKSYGDAVFLLQDMVDKYPKGLPNELALLSEFRIFMQNLKIMRRWEDFVSGQDVHGLTAIPTQEQRDTAESELRTLHEQRKQL
jgi:hypothetical protein